MLVPEGGSQPDAAQRAGRKKSACMLGLPDLAARTENVGSEGLGPWCAMSDPTPHGPAAALSAWCKEKLGWLKPTVIDPTVKQKLVLSPVEDSPKECFKVLVRPDGSEYFCWRTAGRRGSTPTCRAKAC